jgi:hypothetical protein
MSSAVHSAIFFTLLALVLIVGTHWLAEVIGRSHRKGLPTPVQDERDSLARFYREIGVE